MIRLAPVVALLALAAGPDEKKVDDAIRKGVEYLKTSDSPGWSYGVKDSDELVLLTFAHAGVPKGDPRFQELLKKVLESPLETTYEVAVQAMALEEIDRVKHQGRIFQCAQFLVDNQCLNGQWSYGKPTPAAAGVPSTASAPDVSSGRVRQFGAAPAEKPKVVRKLAVSRTRTGPAAGDNSNAQYAALGLRACHEAGIAIPKDVLQLARRGWMDSQIREKTDAVATGKIGGVPAGWCYKGYHHDLKYCASPDQAYATMTAGAVGALAIYDHLLGNDWTKNKAIQNGFAWLAKNWSWTENAGPSEIGGGKPKMFLYYGFYALERAGMLFDLPKIGERDWYAEGAAALLAAQRKDGSWLESAPTFSDKPAWDTCFAILFLKRATRPLVATEAARR